jgi:hypothetical protein
MNEHVSVEWLILADSAQVVGGKLFLLGGGWDVLTVNADFPLHTRCAVAASFRVPWNDTNRPHDIEIEICTEDRRDTLMKANGQIEVGRPPGIPEGSVQRAQIAADMALRFPEPGTYEIVARINGEDKGHVPFRVVPGPMLLLRQQRG